MSLPTSQSPPTAPPRSSALLASARLTHRELIFRVAVVLVILGSVLLAWWSYAKVLPPLQLKSRQLSASVSRSSLEVDELDRKWSKEDMAQVTNAYAQLDDQLFSNRAAFETWLSNLSQRTKPLALDAKAEFGKTAPISAPGEKLAIIPTTISIEVRPDPNAAQSPYHRVLELADQLAGEQKRVDVISLNVSGGLGSISNAAVVVNLWAGEER